MDIRLSKAGFKLEAILAGNSPTFFINLKYLHQIAMWSQIIQSKN